MQLTTGTIAGRQPIGFRPIGSVRVQKKSPERSNIVLDFICFLIPASNFLTFKLIGCCLVGELIVLAC